eukprot:6199177-Pleurochrysis_carterae.AAC.5
MHELASKEEKGNDITHIPVGRFFPNAHEHQSYPSQPRRVRESSAAAPCSVVALTQEKQCFLLTK